MKTARKRLPAQSTMFNRCRKERLARSEHFEDNEERVIDKIERAIAIALTRSRSKAMRSRFKDFRSEIEIYDRDLQSRGLGWKLRVAAAPSLSNYSDPAAHFPPSPALHNNLRTLYLDTFQTPCTSCQKRPALQRNKN